MRAVVQRVSHARVSIGGELVGSIRRGYLILLGVGHADTRETAEKLWGKIFALRINDDAEGKTNLALDDVAGEVLVVSQFTLFANCKKGRRPSFTEAAPPAQATELYEYFVSLARADVPHVATGRFGANMQVELVNDGPFTIVTRKTNRHPPRHTDCRDCLCPPGDCLWKTSFSQVQRDERHRQSPPCHRQCCAHGRRDLEGHAVSLLYFQRLYILGAICTFAPQRRL